MNANDYLIKLNMTVSELTLHSQENKRRACDYATELNVPIRSFRDQLKKAGVIFYQPERHSKKEFICSHCKKTFYRYESEMKNKNRKALYCSPSCHHHSMMKVFDESSFRFSSHDFFKPESGLGDYSSLSISNKQKKNIEKSNYRHDFFAHGIVDEMTAYLFGMFITDGCIAKRKRREYESHLVSLKLLDHDIVHKVARVLQCEDKIHFTKSYAYFQMTSPPLVSDLSRLGCFPKKTESANYPDIDPSFDRHLIRGAIDGDGSWTERTRGNNQISLKIGGNDRFIFGIYKRIKEHLNVTPEFTVDYPIDYDTRYQMKTYCVIRYNKHATKKIRDWLYKDATIYGERKYVVAQSLYLFDDLITTKKLAKHLGVSTKFVLYNLKLYNLPHQKKSTYYTFSPKDIIEWEKFLQKRLKRSPSSFTNCTELIEKWLHKVS